MAVDCYGSYHGSILDPSDGLEGRTLESLPTSAGPGRDACHPPPTVSCNDQLLFSFVNLLSLRRNQMDRLLRGEGWTVEAQKGNKAGGTCWILGTMNSNFAEMIKNIQFYLCQNAFSEKSYFRMRTLYFHSFLSALHCSLTPPFKMWEYFMLVRTSVQSH